MKALYIVNAETKLFLNCGFSILDELGYLCILNIGGGEVNSISHKVWMTAVKTVWPQLIPEKKPK